MQISSSTIALHTSLKSGEIYSSRSVYSWFRVWPTLWAGVLSMGLEIQDYQNKAVASNQLTYTDQSTHDDYLNQSGLAKLAGTNHMVYRTTTHEPWATVERVAKRLLNSQQKVPGEFEAVFQDVFLDVLA